MEGGDWKGAVQMYRAAGMWEGSLRLAKAHGGALATKQVTTDGMLWVVAYVMAVLQSVTRLLITWACLGRKHLLSSVMLYS